VTPGFCKFCGRELTGTLHTGRPLCPTHAHLGAIDPVFDARTGAQLRPVTRWQKMLGARTYCEVCGSVARGIAPGGILCKKHWDLADIEVTHDWCTGQPITADERPKRPDHCIVCGVPDAGPRRGDGLRVCDDHLGLEDPPRRFEPFTGTPLADPGGADRDR
jgi:hypothetical protein